jgi:hypothetical protein
MDEIKDRLAHDPFDFITTYGRAGTRQAAYSLVSEAADIWGNRELGQTFQIHSSKVLGDLIDFLWTLNLAWNPEGFSDGPNYIEMHPRLGEAVMAYDSICVCRKRRTSTSHGVPANV